MKFFFEKWIFPENENRDDDAKFSNSKNCNPKLCAQDLWLNLQFLITKH